MWFHQNITFNWNIPFHPNLVFNLKARGTDASVLGWYDELYPKNRRHHSCACCQTLLFTSRDECYVVDSIKISHLTENSPFSPKPVFDLRARGTDVSVLGWFYELYPKNRQHNSCTRCQTILISSCDECYVGDSIKISHLTKNSPPPQIWVLIWGREVLMRVCWAGSTSCTPKVGVTTVARGFRRY